LFDDDVTEVYAKNIGARNSNFGDERRREQQQQRMAFDGSKQNEVEKMDWKPRT